MEYHPSSRPPTQRGASAKAAPARPLALIVGLGLVLGLSAAVVAITNPISGAVAKPDAFRVSWPFQAGQRVYVTSGYGPSMGSSLHRNTEVTGSANDHYALDLVLPDHPNNGHGQPVLAMAPGTVVKAGWATAGWANYGLRVIVRHDFNDGHSYVTLYAHLDQIAVREGDHVEQGQRLGDLGDSCEGDSQNRSCPFFGAHLHIAMHRDSNIGGSGTGGSYGGRAVVMEPIDGAQDIVQGNTFTSQNNGQPPAPCATIERRETILEDDGPCLTRQGPPQYWHEESQGHGGRSFWTYTIADPAPDNSARWNLNFAQAGEYDLWAYIPRAFGQSQRARYVVRHEGRQDEAVRDQRASPDDWLSLGRFRFAQGGDQSVLLEDNTGEPYINANDNTKIAFDALRIRPAQDCACSGASEESQACGRCGARTRRCDGCNWGDFGACQGEGPCANGDLEEQACGSNGVQRRTCSDTCQWGGFDACLEDGDPPAEDAGTPDAAPNADADDLPTADADNQGDAASDDLPEPDDLPEGDPEGSNRRVTRSAQGCATPASAPTPAALLLALALLIGVARRKARTNQLG